MTDLKQKSAHFIALAGAATPGRWYEHGDTVWTLPDGDDESSICVAQECSNEDSAFIASVPAMAQHIAALQAENDALRSCVIEISSMVPETQHARGFSTNALVGLLEGIGRTSDDAINRERGE